MSDTNIQQLLDKDAIRDVMLRYCRAVDRRDWELLRTAFFEDCVDDHAEFHGRRDDFIAWLSARHDVPDFRKSTHFLGNCLIEFASERAAAVETYFIARLELAVGAGGHRKMLLGDSSAAQEAGNVKVEILGRYIDRFEKREGEWRVARRRTVFDQSHAFAAGDAGRLNPEWILGTRDRADPVYAVRTEAGLR